MHHYIRAGIGALLLSCLGAAAPGPAALDRVATGWWVLHDLDDPASPRALCVRDPAQLLQLHHPGAACSHFVVTDRSDQLVVEYSCRGAGQERTALTVETPRLIQLQTQGIAAGRPFAVRYEGRQTGACPGRRR